MVQSEGLELEETANTYKGQPETRVGKFFFNGACIIIGVIIAPFILTYWGVRWLCGIRPPFQGKSACCSDRHRCRE